MTPLNCGKELAYPRNCVLREACFSAPPDQRTGRPHRRVRRAPASNPARKIQVPPKSTGRGTDRGATTAKKLHMDPIPNHLSADRIGQVRRLRHSATLFHGRNRRAKRIKRISGDTDPNHPLFPEWIHENRSLAAVSGPNQELPEDRRKAPILKNPLIPQPFTTQFACRSQSDRAFTMQIAMCHRFCFYMGDFLIHCSGSLSHGSPGAVARRTQLPRVYRGWGAGRRGTAFQATSMAQPVS